MSKTLKMLCTQCNRLNGMHVEDVKDICMECNTVYCRLNYMHVEDVEDDKKYSQCSLLNKQRLIYGGSMQLRSHFTKPKMQGPLHLR